jgi:uncharacterized protein YggE
MDEQTNQPHHKMCCHGGGKFILIIILSVFLLVLTASDVLNIKEKLKPKDTISFSGEGKTVGIPDVATITLSVISEKMTAKETLAENSLKTNEIIKFAKESGVADKDVKTQSYYLSPRYDWLEGKRISRGYQLTSTLLVKIRDLDKVGDIIEGAVTRGANQVGDVQFVIDDLEKLKTDARRKAIENAKNRAQAIAATAGLNLGKIVGFSETSSPDVYPKTYYLEMGVGGGGSAAAPNMERGSQEIVMNVSLTFELKR